MTRTVNGTGHFEGGVGLGLGGLRAHGVALEVLGLYAITVDGALNSRRTRRPRVLLHELAVRGDRVVADGLYGGTAQVGAPMDVSSLADTRFDWTQMKMHILERRDAVLAHFVVGVVEEEAHRCV